VSSEVCITNFFPRIVNQAVYFKFWNVYGSTLIEKAKSLGGKVDFSWQYSFACNTFSKYIFGWKIKHLCWNIHCIYLVLHHLSSHISKTENLHQWISF
jgi:hypothetical protein